LKRRFNCTGFALPTDSIASGRCSSSRLYPILTQFFALIPPGPPELFEVYIIMLFFEKREVVGRVHIANKKYLVLFIATQVTGFAYCSDVFLYETTKIKETQEERCTG